MLCVLSTDRKRDLGGAAQRIARALDPGLDGGEIRLGRRQQLFALAGALGGQVRIAANDQPLTRVIGRGDGGHVALIEQAGLDGVAVQQVLDRRRA